MMNILKILFLIFSICYASRCPEARKPHVTSCTVYYDCMNLPEGGYVWIPSKCADGLVFQPYLRLCVLPGDNWDCKDSIKSPTKNPIYPDLIDETKTSYHEINLVNSSMNLNGIENLGNYHPIIPYPMIEIKQVTDDNDEKIQQDNLDILKNPQQKIQTSASRLFLFINFGAYLNNNKNFLSSSMIENPSREVLIQLFKNYMINHGKTINSKRKNLIKDLIIRKTTTEKSIQDEMNSTPTSFSSELMIDGTSHIVAITGNFGERKYVTIDQYKELSNKNNNIQVNDIIPCVLGGTRLPNLTDCVRYYTCDPNTAIIHEFHCPPQTAFNTQTNFCDPRKYKSCVKNHNIKSTIIEITTSTFPPKLLSLKNNNNNQEKQEECETTGKFSDLTSDKFYYLCYLSKNSGLIESMKISCPNDLIFCQGRKVCTTKRLCLESD